MILNDQYHEFLGFVYEDIIRSSIFQYALDYKLPFMPRSTGKWWGQICRNGEWQESEIDVIAYDDHHLIVGECKYRNKAAGIQELDNLKLKAQFIPSKGRELFCLLASKNGFTEDLKQIQDSHLILIDQI